MHKSIFFFQSFLNKLRIRLVFVGKMDKISRQRHRFPTFLRNPPRKHFYSRRMNTVCSQTDVSSSVEFTPCLFKTSVDVRNILTEVFVSAPSNDFLKSCCPQNPVSRWNDLKKTSDSPNVFTAGIKEARRGLRAVRPRTYLGVCRQRVGGLVSREKVNLFCYYYYYHLSLSGLVFIMYSTGLSG